MSDREPQGGGAPSPAAASPPAPRAAAAAAAAEPMTAPEYGARKLFALSLPAIAASTLEPVAGMVDTALVGHLDSRALAALGVTVAILSAFTWIFNFLVNAVTAHVAGALGRGRRAELGARIRLALMVALAAGALSGLALVLLREPLVLGAMGADPALAAEARGYYLVRAFGLPLVLLATAQSGVLRGLARLRLALLAGLLITLSNVALTWFLLYVLRVGLVGAAIGTVASFAIGVFFVAAVFRRERRALGLDARAPLELSLLADFGRDAGNLVLRTGSLVGAFFVASAAATRIGALEVAAHQVALQLWLLSSFFVDGFAIAANTVGARLIGAGHPEARRAAGRRLLGFGLATGLGFALVYGAGRPLIQGLFTDDPLVVAHLDAIWWIVAATQPLNALVYVYDGLLFGSRAFAFLRTHMAIALVVFFLPLVAWRGFGAEELPGVWLALAALNAYRLVSCAWRFEAETRRAGA